MKCAICFVLLIVVATLAGCGGKTEEVKRAQMESKVEYIKIYEIQNSDLSCAEGIVYVRIGVHGYTAKINEATLLPERCKDVPWNTNTN